jgi:hypothetical protein
VQTQRPDVALLIRLQVHFAAARQYFRISNRDIGFVSAGQQAEVKIDTFNFTLRRCARLTLYVNVNRAVGGSAILYTWLIRQSIGPTRLWDRFLSWLVSRSGSSEGTNMTVNFEN